MTAWKVAGARVFVDGALSGETLCVGGNGPRMVGECVAQDLRPRTIETIYSARTWAVESAHGLGYLLAQQLVAAGENVIDVPPVRASRVRVLGSGRSQKNDPNDASSKPRRAGPPDEPTTATLPPQRPSGAQGL